MLPEGMHVTIRKDAWEVLPIFKMLQRMGNVEEKVMYNTFNMGIGMVLAVAKEDVDAAMAAIRAAGETPYVLGSAEKGEKGTTLS